MILVLVFILPTMLGQILTPSRPLLSASRREIGLLMGSAFLQLAAGTLPELSHLLLPASFAGGTFAFALLTWTSGHNRTATSLAVLGGIANLVPIAWFGFMPVRSASRQMIAEDALQEPTIIASKHAEVAMELSVSDPLSLLVDWIPVAPLDAVISVGDVLLVAALAWLGLAKRRSARVQPSPYAANNASDGSSDVCIA